MSDTEAAPAKAKKGGKLIPIVLSVVMTAAGAGGTWFWMQRNAHAAAPHAEKVEPPKKALFNALEPFTVNLQEPRGDRFAQVGVTLEFDDPAVDEQIKERLPALRNNILMLLSSKRVDELLTAEGKAQLAAEIRERSGQALGWEAPAKAVAKAEGHAEPKAEGKAGKPNPVRGVLFSQFIVQ